MQVALQQLNSGCAWEAGRGWRGPVHTQGDVREGWAALLTLLLLPWADFHPKVLLCCQLDTVQGTWGIKQVSPTLWNSQFDAGWKTWGERASGLWHRKLLKWAARKRNVMGLGVPAPLFLIPTRKIHWTFTWLFPSAKYDNEGKKNQERKERKY